MAVEDGIRPTEVAEREESAANLGAAGWLGDAGSPAGGAADPGPDIPLAIDPTIDLAIPVRPSGGPQGYLGFT